MHLTVCNHETSMVLPSGSERTGSPLEVVRSYRNRGWSIIPIEHGTKRNPLALKGVKFEWSEFQLRHPTDEELNQWFGGPDCFTEYAVILGSVSGGLAGRDFDTEVSYANWADEYHEWACVLPTVKTPRGCHVYFRLSTDSPLKHGTVLNYTDGELRLSRCFCLLPDSVHPSGFQYKWIVPLPDGDLPEIDPVEIGMVGELIKPAKGRRKAGDIITAGQRNSTLTSIAGAKRHFGQGEDEIRESLHQVNAGRCDPPLPESEVSGIAGSIAKYPPGNAQGGSADDPHRLARLYISEACMDDRGRLTLRHWRHEWWRWSGTHYEVIDKDELRALLAGFTKAKLDRWAESDPSAKPPRKVTHQLLTNVIQALAGEVILPFKMDQPAWLGDGEQNRSYLSMSNGLLDVNRFLAGEPAYLIDHTPEWFSPHHLPYPFDPKAKCPQWQAFLDEILEGDQERIRRLQEWFGYCLLPDTSLQKFIVLEGEGANGKSVVCAVQADLLGRQNVSHVPLERFGDRFQLTMTLGKLANIASEVGDLDKAAEGVLKAFTAGDRMGFDRKGIVGVEAFPTARLVLATNNRPRFSDRSSGLWRRMILIPFRVTIPEDQQDTLLADKLRAELSGIFCWALVGRHRLRRSGRFTRSVLGDEALEEYRAEVNPARLFLTEHCYEEPLGSVACERAYGTYKSWCDSNGYHPLGERMFGKEVCRVYPAAKRTRKGTREKREYRYEGISVSQVP